MFLFYRFKFELNWCRQRWISYKEMPGKVQGTYNDAYQHCFFIGFILIQASYYTLEEKIKITNRRVNALEYVLIPRIVATLIYIN